GAQTAVLKLPPPRHRACRRRGRDREGEGQAGVRRLEGGGGCPGDVRTAYPTEGEIGREPTEGRAGWSLSGLQLSVPRLPLAAVCSTGATGSRKVWRGALARHSALSAHGQAVLSHHETPGPDETTERPASMALAPGSTPTPG